MELEIDVEEPWPRGAWEALAVRAADSAQRLAPELANPRMDCWAAYLRGQADALNLSIIDTSNDSLDVSCKMLEGFVRQLLDRTRKL